MVTILNDKNLVEVPAEITKRLGISCGAQFEWQVGERPDQITIHVKTTRRDIINKIKEIGHKYVKSGRDHSSELALGRANDEEKPLSRNNADERFAQFQQEIRAIDKAAEERNKLAEDRSKLAAESFAQFQQEMRQSKRDLDKKWIDFVNKMGTMVEDIVAPNLPRIAKEHFQLEAHQRFTIRTYARKIGKPGYEREFDAILVYPEAVLINETKSNPDRKDVELFENVLKEFHEYFPEHASKRIIPIFASMHIPESIINLLTKKKIYGLAMGDDTMELVNPNL